MEDKQRSPKDKYILFAFLGFFSVIFAVDAVFVTTSISTYTGVVSERAYETGLHYNETLEEARNQPVVEDSVEFSDNILRWNLNDETLSNAKVTARIIRPIQEGDDFDIDLVHKERGIYEAKIDLPFKGLWEAKLESKWNNKTYKTTYQFIVK